MTDGKDDVSVGVFVATLCDLLYAQDQSEKPQGEESRKERLRIKIDKRKKSVGHAGGKIATGYKHDYEKGHDLSERFDRLANEFMDYWKSKFPEAAIVEWAEGEDLAAPSIGIVLSPCSARTILAEDPGRIIMLPPNIIIGVQRPGETCVTCGKVIVEKRKNPPGYDKYAEDKE